MMLMGCVRPLEGWGGGRWLDYINSWLYKLFQVSWRCGQARDMSGGKLFTWPDNIEVPGLPFSLVLLWLAFDPAATLFSILLFFSQKAMNSTLLLFDNVGYCRTLHRQQPKSRRLLSLLLSVGFTEKNSRYLDVKCSGESRMMLPKERVH